MHVSEMSYTHMETRFFWQLFFVFSRVRPDLSQDTIFNAAISSIALARSIFHQARVAKASDVKPGQRVRLSRWSLAKQE